MGSSIEETRAILASWDKDADDLRGEIKDCEDHAKLLGLLYTEKMKEAHDRKQSLQALQERAANLYATIAPVSLVPDEVLSMIFEAFVSEWECGSTRQEGWDKLAAFLLTITTVSKRWRHVALHTPRIWCNISYFSRSHAERYRHASKTRSRRPMYPSVEMCLKYSGTLPLFFCAYGEDGIIDTLCTMGENEVLDRITRLELGEEGGDDIHPDLLTFLTRTPLCNVRNLKVDWFNQAKPGPFAGFLVHLNNLRSLTIQHTMLDLDDEPLPGGAVVLSRLEQLRLFRSSKHMAAELLRWLWMPHLQALHIDIESLSDDMDDPPEHLLLSCLPKALHSVQTLTLSGHLSTEDAFQVLEHASRISFLELVEPGSDFDFDDLLGAYVAKSDGAQDLFMPRLHSLSIDDAHHTFIGLIRFIDSRLTSRVSKLKHLNVSETTLALYSKEERDELGQRVEIQAWTPYPLRRDYALFY